MDKDSLKKVSMARKVAGISFASLLFLVFLMIFCGFEYVNLLCLDLKDNTLSAKWDESNAGEAYEVVVSDSRLFIKPQVKVSDNNVVFFDDLVEDRYYVKIRPSGNNVSLFGKVYVLENHTHTDLWNEELSVCADCDSEGYLFCSCEDCDNLSGVVVEKLGHDYKVCGHIKPTCYMEGYIVYKCSRCCDEVVVSAEKTEHSFEYAKKLESSSCVKQGSALYVCLVCSEEEVRLLDYASHNYGYHSEGADSSVVVLTKKCNVCGNLNNVTFNRLKGAEFKGMLWIPSLNICVPVNYGGYPNQWVCDAANSASLQTYSLGIKDVIADHYYQGNFTNIRRAVVGQTIMYYKGERYVCSENCNGVNNKRFLADSNGNDIRYGASDVYLYTCNNNAGVSVRIVGWKKA